MRNGIYCSVDSRVQEMEGQKAPRRVSERRGTREIKLQGRNPCRLSASAQQRNAITIIALDKIMLHVRRPSGKQLFPHRG